MHTVCHSVLFPNSLIPKLNGVVHKTVWRVTTAAPSDGGLAFLYGGGVSESCCQGQLVVAEKFT